MPTAYLISGPAQHHAGILLLPATDSTPAEAYGRIPGDAAEVAAPWQGPLEQPESVFMWLNGYPRLRVESYKLSASELETLQREHPSSASAILSSPKSTVTLERRGEGGAGQVALNYWTFMNIAAKTSKAEEAPMTATKPDSVVEAAEQIAAKAGSYIHRTLPGNVKDFDLLDYALKRQENVLLYGPTQSGKTTLPVAYAEARGLKCVTISGDAAMDPSELFGHRTLQNGSDGYAENHVTDVIRTGGVLIIDEINMFSQKILSPLFSLLDSRREVRIRDKGGEVVKAHRQLLIVATMNPRYAGTTSMSEALLDRFAHRHEWDYSDEVEAQLVPSASLRELFNGARAHADIDTPLSTSLLIQFAEDIQGLGWEYAKHNMVSRSMDAEEREVLKQLLDVFKDKIAAELDPAERERQRKQDEARAKAREKAEKKRDKLMQESAESKAKAIRAYLDGPAVDLGEGLKEEIINHVDMLPSMAEFSKAPWDD